MPAAAVARRVNRGEVCRARRRAVRWLAGGHKVHEALKVAKVNTS